MIRTKTIDEIQQRIYKKMREKLKTMQAMWIHVHRMENQYIDRLSNEELERQYKLHDALWAENDTKPKKQPTCSVCKTQTGLNEQEKGICKECEVECEC